VKSAVTPQTAEAIINDPTYVHYASSLETLQQMSAAAGYERDEAFFALAISAERLTDRLRLLQLLKTYRYVIGVAVTKDIRLRELEPFAKAGRYVQINEDFKTLKETKKSRSLILQEIEKYNNIPVIVCLDYQWLQNGYYESRYGLNWLGARGKVNRLLEAGATEVYLPNDKNESQERGLTSGKSKAKALHLSEVEIMVRDNQDNALNIQYVQTTPLYASDMRLGPVTAEDKMVRDPVDQKLKFLSSARPFLRVS